MSTIADRIRRTLKSKTVVRITSKSRNAAGYDITTPNGNAHCSSRAHAEVLMLTAARIASKQVWTITPTKKGKA
jgi:hypothetical protein